VRDLEFHQDRGEDDRFPKVAVAFRPADDIKTPRVRGFMLGLDRGWASVLSRTLGIAKMMTSAEEMKGSAVSFVRSVL
jgi:hypothetical protein